MIMGADQNKKKIAALIVSRMKPSGESEDVKPEGEISTEGGLSEGERAAGEELLDAFAAKDAQGVVEAIRSLFSIFDGSESEAPEEPKSAFVES